MRLLVISHTAHYYDATGNVVGWGPTVKEIDCLATYFNEVVHIACLHSREDAPPSAAAYSSSNIKFIPISPFGGRGLKNKLKIIATAWSNINKIRKALKDADIFQFRAPTSIGLYIIPYLTFFTKKKGWYKYAGNWVQIHAPLSYRIQKWMLLNIQDRKITINGRWIKQQNKCISFENPCLTDKDREEGEKCMNSRDFRKPLRFCFVGRLDKQKGIYLLLDALGQYPEIKSISGLDIVGDGPELKNIKTKISETGLDVRIYGALSREEVFNIYKRADFIILPTESEGFPKVIAEASNFGCIPIVSDISSIGQYVNDTNGFLWKCNEMSFVDFFNGVDINNANMLKEKAVNAHKMSADFTYVNYINKLREYIVQ